jgi:hypothetical protein
MPLKTILAPVAIPLVITLAVGLAGPGGPLGLTHRRVDPPSVVRPESEAVGRPIASPIPAVSELTEVEALRAVRGYATDLISVDVSFDHCSATLDGEVWSATCQASGPLCERAVPRNKPCVTGPVTLSFFVHPDGSIVPADGATALILLTY